MLNLTRIFALLALFTTTAFADYDGKYTSVNLGTLYDGHGITGGGGSLFLGAHANRYFAPELQANFYSTGSERLGIYGLDLKFVAPVRESVSLFAKVGYGLGELYACSATCSTTDTGVGMFGAGVGYGFLPEWMATFEFNGAYFLNSVANGHSVMGGLTLGITRYWAW